MTIYLVYVYDGNYIDEVIPFYRKDKAIERREIERKAGNRCLMVGKELIGYEPNRSKSKPSL